MFAAASKELVIVDGWLGSTILPTLRAVAPIDLRVRFLTVTQRLRPDFHVELETFRKQMPGVEVEVRGSSEFHDRFAMVDGCAAFISGRPSRTRALAPSWSAGSRIWPTFTPSGKR